MNEIESVKQNHPEAYNYWRGEVERGETLLGFHDWFELVW